MCGWDEPAQRFLNDAGYGNNEQGFWRWFWTDMATTLKDYPNVIFDAWNEPNVGTDADPIPEGFMSYLQTMYDAVRSTGATNLIMMQWHMGWFPNDYGNDLSWVKQIDDTFNPKNVVYTTHLYYYAPTDLSSYWATDYEGLKAQLQTGIDSMGIIAPLVINEEGSCLNNSPDKQRDITWWTNLLAAQADLRIGTGAYYWLSDAGLGPIYAGETMLSNGNQPNDMGQAYINAKIPTSMNIEQPTQIAASASPIIETQTSTPIIIPKPTCVVTLTPEPTATPTPTSETTNTTAPTELATPKHLDVVRGFFYRNWFIFNLQRHQTWFVYPF
ncbi:MAG: glycoside hydrolase family 5 protein [Crenarchaeota archaeon]|nr:glycoside hydrolase family 5 protein [Thermoproteota archaeon]